MIKCKSIGIILGLVAVVFGIAVYYDVMAFTMETLGLILMAYGAILILACFVSKK